MAHPDYYFLDPDEMEEHHNSRTSLSFDGRPRVRGITTPDQDTTETESKAMRFMRVLCCQIILPHIRGKGPRDIANGTTEHKSGTKAKVPPPVIKDLLASIRTRREKQKAKEADEAFFRPRKVERYDWSKYDPEASDDDVDVWKVKSLSEPDESSVVSYEPCSPSDDGSSIHEPEFPSDFGSSTLSFGDSLLMSPEQPLLPAICANTVPPVRSNRFLDSKQGTVDSVGLSRERADMQSVKEAQSQTKNIAPQALGLLSHLD
ncbi:hypothetical protein PG994_014817 [Apiospora phragmitis]|uniref:Uncharacterized protein n=1 Tax=Apiospora phragmitis TaxID=2905665 RepID=A0ABR1SUP1_9PEZI